MSAERVIMAEMVQRLRRALEKEEEAIGTALAVFIQEKGQKRSYDSGADLGAFAAASILSLEKEVQSCVTLFEQALAPIGEHHFDRCREPLLRMAPESRLDAVLRQDMMRVALRIQSLEALEQEILAMPPEDALRILGPDAAERLEAELDQGLKDL